MIIRNRTTKTLKGSRITGRGEAPAKRSSNVSPIIGRPEGATLAVQERATDSSATPSGFAYCIHLAGVLPLPVILSALRALAVRLHIII